MPTQTASLYHTFDQVHARLSPAFDEAGVAVDVEAASMAVSLDHGRASLSASDSSESCLLTIEADSDWQLAEVREIVAAYIHAFALSPGLRWRSDETSRSGRRPANFSLATIVENRRLSPSFQRLRLAGDFRRFLEGGAHFRLLFGPEGADWPSIGESGETHWPEGMEAWHRPPYTVRSLDAAGRWVDVDIFLHDGGRVSEWVQRSEIGNKVGLSGPMGGLPEVAAWNVLIADETAVPLVLRHLEELPRDSLGVAWLVVPDARDVQHVAHPPGVDVRWLPRGKGRGLPELVAQLALPDDNCHVFVAGERSDIAHCRRQLADRGLAREQFQAIAYWMAAWTPSPRQPSRLARLNRVQESS